MPHLEEETWGDRVKRARDRSGLTLEQAAARVATVMPVSYGALARLEKLPDAPKERQRRFMAYLTVLAYGFDPAGLGLDDSAIPALIDRDRLAELVRNWPPTPRALRLAASSPASTRWTIEVADQEAA